MQRAFAFPIRLGLAGAVPGQEFGAHFQLDGGAQEFAAIIAIMGLRREAP